MVHSARDMRPDATGSLGREQGTKDHTPGEPSSEGNAMEKAMRTEPLYDRNGG